MASWASAVHATQLTVFAVLEEGEGQQLRVLDDPHFTAEGPKGVTPGYVRHEILSAIAAGWKPMEEGAEYVRDRRRRMHTPERGRPMLRDNVEVKRMRLRVHAEPGLLEYHFPWEHKADKWTSFRFFHAMKPPQIGTIIAYLADYNGISPTQPIEEIFKKLAGLSPLDTDPEIAAKMSPSYEIRGGIAIIIGARKLMNYGCCVNSSSWMSWWELAQGRVDRTWNGHDPKSSAVRRGDRIQLQDCNLREGVFKVEEDQFLQMVDQLEEDVEGGLDSIQEWLEENAPAETVDLIIGGMREAIYGSLQAEEEE